MIYNRNSLNNYLKLSIYNLNCQRINYFNNRYLWLVNKNLIVVIIWINLVKLDVFPSIIDPTLEFNWQIYLR